MHFFAQNVYFFNFVSQDSSVGIGTDYGLVRRGWILSRDKSLSPLNSIQTGSGVVPASRTGVISPGA